MQQANAFEPQADIDRTPVKSEATSAAPSEQAADQNFTADVSAPEKPEDTALAFQRDLQSLSTVLSNTFGESGPDTGISQLQICKSAQSHHLTPDQARSLVWECPPSRKPFSTIVDTGNKDNGFVSAAGVQQKVSSQCSSFKLVDQED
jgi:hypothetical protein